MTPRAPTDFTHSSGDLQVDRRYDYARALAESGDTDAAIDLLLQTRDIASTWPALPFMLGKLYTAQGHIQDALECFRETLLLDPTDHQGAMLEMEILGTPVIEGAMPAAFVETLFDQYAPRFDTHLTETLDYEVPQLIAHMVTKYYPDLLAEKILDLGCGTGLAAEHFSATASWIEGVDLSGGMLDLARQKGLYHRLEQADLSAHLSASHEQFDLIIAADVLSYFGGLSDVFNAIRPRLGTNGVLVFSVQKLQATPGFEPDYHLGEEHRFTHTERYITRALTESGLSVIACEEQTLRKDRGAPVTGLVFVCEKINTTTCIQTIKNAPRLSIAE